jgi:hypothetical protein
MIETDEILKNKYKIMFGVNNILVPNHTVQRNILQ